MSGMRVRGLRVNVFIPNRRWLNHALMLDERRGMVTDTAFFRNPNYHLPSDAIDTLDFTFMAG